MSNNELVSIVLPNYNKGSFALEAVQSVLNQTYPNIEVVFVDDHSTDGSDLPIHKLSISDPRVRFLKTKAPKSGGGLARNMGVKLAKGDFLVFLDSDDIMSPDCIEERIQQFGQHNECAFLVFQVGIFFDEVGDSSFVFNQKSEKPDLERFFIRDLPWHTSGPIWKKSFFEQIGGFDEDLISQQDSDIHIRAVIRSKAYKHFYGLPKIYYRQNVDSIPRSESQSFLAIKQRVQMLKRHIELLKKTSDFTSEIRLAIAQYLLDLAQMLRWYKSRAGVNALAEAYQIWTIAFDECLVDDTSYRKGMSYIKFKHNMLWNRVPSLMARREAAFRSALGALIHTPSPTLSKTPYRA